MISSAPIVTDAGKSLQIRAMGGEKITFTCFKLGSGELPEGSTGSELVDLVVPEMIVPINDIDTSDIVFAKITGKFDNTMIESDFKWTELGLFGMSSTEEEFEGTGTQKSFTLTSNPPIVHSVAVDDVMVTIQSYADGVVTLATAPAQGAKIVVSMPDGDEKLYAYSYDGGSAGTLVADSTDVLAEQTISFVIAIGDAEQVTAMISASTLYATKTEFVAHESSRSNPHHVTKQQIGLGNVSNTTPENTVVTFVPYTAINNISSGEKTSTVFAKIAGAIAGLLAHIADKKNPHGVTYNQLGAAAASHVHSTGDITSGTLPVTRGGTGQTSVDSTPTQNSAKLVTSAGIFEALAKKAAATHTHALSDITTGVLAVSRGGTGQTSVDTTPTAGSAKMVTSGGVKAALDGKANSTHYHDDRYYTEGEMNSFLAGKSNTSHTHDDRYYTEGEVNSLLSGKEGIASVGSNASGYFVKFANGLMVCWGGAGTPAGGSTAATTKFLPASFANTAYSTQLTVTGVDNLGDYTVRVINNGVDNFKYRTLLNGEAVSGVGLYYVCVGFWK